MVWRIVWVCRWQDPTKQRRENQVRPIIVKKKASDDPDWSFKISTWAPQKDLNTDQMVDPRRHSNFAPIGTGLNLFCWVSKKLDGLDWNLMNFLKEHENDQRDYLEVLKNLEKIPNNPRNIRRPCLCSLWRLIWWSGVGHQDDETVAEGGCRWNCFEQMPGSVYCTREIYSSLYLDCFGRKKLDVHEPVLWYHDRITITEKRFRILLRLY